MSYASAVRVDRSNGANGEQLLPTFLKRQETMRERGPNGKFPVRMPNLVYGTRIDKSPFFESTTNAGCTDYTVYNKMLMPIAWDGVTPEEEYWALRRDVCLWDVSVQRQIQLVGPDAAGNIFPVWGDYVIMILTMIIRASGSACPEALYPEPQQNESESVLLQPHVRQRR